LDRDEQSEMARRDRTRRNALIVDELGHQRMTFWQSEASSSGTTCRAANNHVVRFACEAEDVAGSVLQSSTRLKGPSASPTVWRNGGWHQSESLLRAAW
jgi:hypothetical protein